MRSCPQGGRWWRPGLAPDANVDRRLIRGSDLGRADEGSERTHRAQHVPQMDANERIRRRQRRHPAPGGSEMHRVRAGRHGVALGGPGAL